MNNKIPSKFLNKHPISSDIELTVAEFHQNKRKWLSFCVYKPPNQNDSVFMESICAIINEYSVQCEHRVTLVILICLLKTLIHKAQCKYMIYLPL